MNLMRTYYLYILNFLIKIIKINLKYMSFLFNDKKGVMLSKGKVVSLHNFLLSGQYMQTPGGLPLALASGRFSIQWIKFRQMEIN